MELEIVQYLHTVAMFIYNFEPQNLKFIGVSLATLTRVFKQPEYETPPLTMQHKLAWQLQRLASHTEQVEPMHTA